VRPNTLSITDIATLISDPYAIYLSKILKIRPLDELDEESDAGLFGNIVHAGLAAYFASATDFGSPDAIHDLNNALQISMRKKRPRAALEHWWDARLNRIAKWVIETEQERRAVWGDPTALSLELSGNLDVAEKFTLTGRADRIERRLDGSIFIIDYKTGTAPDTKSVLSGRAPQLPLEAVMAEAGAFGVPFTGQVNEMAVWKLSGGRIDGNETSFFDDVAELRQLIDQVAARLPALFLKFSAAEVPYLAAPHPDRQLSRDIFAGISRRAEWIDGPDAVSS
jgi:ATP-dependent helicase/nuclease subunit B